MSRRPGDPQHRSLVEGQHLAVPGAAQAALPDRIAADGEPVPGLQPELVRHQPAGDQIRVGERPPRPLLGAGQELLHPEHLPPGRLVIGHGLSDVMTSPPSDPPRREYRAGSLSAATTSAHGTSPGSAAVVKSLWPGVITLRAAVNDGPYPRRRRPQSGQPGGQVLRRHRRALRRDRPARARRTACSVCLNWRTPSVPRPTRSAGYRSSSGGLRKLQSVMGRRWRLAPDRRIRRGPPPEVSDQELIPDILICWNRSDMGWVTVCGSAVAAARPIRCCA